MATDAALTQGTAIKFSKDILANESALDRPTNVRPPISMPSQAMVKEGEMNHNRFGEEYQYKGHTSRGRTYTRTFKKDSNGQPVFNARRQMGFEKSVQLRSYVDEHGKEPGDMCFATEGSMKGFNRAHGDISNRSVILADAAPAIEVPRTRPPQKYTDRSGPIPVDKYVEHDTDRKHELYHTSDMRIAVGEQRLFKDGPNHDEQGKVVQGKRGDLVRDDTGATVEGQLLKPRDAPLGVEKGLERALKTAEEWGAEVKVSTKVKEATFTVSNTKAGRVPTITVPPPEQYQTQGQAASDIVRACSHFQQFQLENRKQDAARDLKTGKLPDSPAGTYPVHEYLDAPPAQRAKHPGMAKAELIAQCATLDTVTGFGGTFTPAPDERRNQMREAWAKETRTGEGFSAVARAANAVRTLNDGRDPDQNIHRGRAYEQRRAQQDQQIARGELQLPSTRVAAAAKREEQNKARAEQAPQLGKPRTQASDTSRDVAKRVAALPVRPGDGGGPPPPSGPDQTQTQGRN